MKENVAIDTSSPSDAEWAEALTVGKATLAQAGGDRTRTGALVFSDGGSPSAKQRQLIRELYGNNPPPLALVTDSLLALGAGAISNEKIAEHFEAMQGELGPLAVLQPFLDRGPR